MPNEIENNKKNSPFKIITDTIQRLYWTTQGVRVFALVGKSGSGKSYKAKSVAQKFDIPIIIDDGIIIEKNKVIAGHSAKSELNFLQAVRVSLFDDLTHRQNAIKALEKTNFIKILLLGTSDKMVLRIAEHLNLPEIYRIIRIEEVSTPKEISTAQKSRSAGNHVIPVPTDEIAKNCPHILYDRIKVFLLLPQGFMKRKIHNFVEKTIVRPVFQQQFFLQQSPEEKIARIKTVLHESTQNFEPRFKISHIKINLYSNNLASISCRLSSTVPSAVNMLQSFKDYATNHLEKAVKINCKEFHTCFRRKNI